jgi:hypothetical protein
MSGSHPGDTATVIEVGSSTSSEKFLDPNNNRVGFMVFNDSTSILYIKYGEDAASDSYTVKVAAGGYFENSFPSYRGPVYGVWSAENGHAYVTEIS